MISRIVVLVCFFWGVPLIAGAATFTSEPHTIQTGVGQLAAFTLYLDTEGEAVNALEGVVRYDEKKFVFKNVADGDSIITTWLKKLSTSGPGQLSFSGIIPGGYNGGKGKLLVLYFTAREEGDGAIMLDGSGYLNDGKGTRLAVGSLSDSVRVVQGKVAGALAEVPSEDEEKPQLVKAVIAQNEAMFDGKPFIIVDARDDASGVSRYEILYSNVPIAISILEKDERLSWQNIKNLNVLKDPLPRYVYVRVTDYVGNAEVVQISGSDAQLSPPPAQLWFSPFAGFGILVVGLVILFFFYRLKKPSHAP